MGKLEKTDKAGKTVEAWWALLFAEGSLGQSILRWGLPVIGGAIGVWVASATDWISSYGVAGWAATIMLGALGAIWGLAGFEHVRTKRWLRDHAADVPVNAGTDSDLIALIDSRLEKFLATTLRAEFVTNDEKLASLDEEVKVALGNIDSLKNEIGEVPNKLGNLEQQFSDWTHAHIKDQEHQFKNVDGGFRAIHDREKLIEMAAGIESDAKWLLRSRDGEKVDDWGEWNLMHSEWMMAIRNYAIVAERYLNDVPRKIGDVPSHEIQGRWPEDRSLFPGDDEVIAYRTATLTLRNFNSEHKRVMQCVTSWAFEAPSKKGLYED